MLKEKHKYKNDSGFALILVGQILIIIRTIIVFLLLLLRTSLLLTFSKIFNQSTSFNPSTPFNPTSLAVFIIAVTLAGLYLITGTFMIVGCIHRAQRKKKVTVLHLVLATLFFSFVGGVISSVGFYLERKTEKISLQNSDKHLKTHNKQISYYSQSQASSFLVIGQIFIIVAAFFWCFTIIGALWGIPMIIGSVKRINQTKKTSILHIVLAFLFYGFLGIIGGAFTIVGDIKVKKS